MAKHPQAELLTEVVLGETNVSSSGFPYISDRSFHLFIQKVPHLFRHGEAILEWLAVVKRNIADSKSIAADEAASINRAIQVLRTVVYTAGVTAPPDLWLVKQVLATHQQLGITEDLRLAEGLDPAESAARRNLSVRHLMSDLNLLFSRGYLRKAGTRFFASNDPLVAAALDAAPGIEERHRVNLVPRLAAWFGGNSADTELLSDWLRFDFVERPTGSWIADRFQIELGYRLTPLVLSLKVCEFTDKLSEGTVFSDAVPRSLPEMIRILEHAGIVEDGRITDFGDRVFERGPGPFGIVGAYHPYLNNLASLLTSGAAGVHVQRGENVAASQDANRKTFEQANDKLDAFSKKYGFRYAVFIEHAVGRGEATRQRMQRSGESEIRYFGADLEDAAIDQAVEQQKRGLLPQNMEFIRSADIGNPAKVVEFLAARGLANEPTVMMVGNGFHEIRQQTNDRMIEVLRSYQRAGFVLIFTEESALDNDDLLQTAWNTYHAGFRYVHELSGQGLRPAVDREGRSDRWSWRRCAAEAGYLVVEGLSYKSRTIYPYKRPQKENPSISETYFCVPARIAESLAIPDAEITTGV